MEEGIVYEVSAVHQQNKTISLMHFSQLLNYVSGFFGIIAVIIIWQMNEKEIPEMRKHAIEILNFQISLFIYVFASIPLVWMFGALSFFVVIIFLLMLGFIAPILGGNRALNGEWYKYPMTIRLLK